MAELIKICYNNRVSSSVVGGYDIRGRSLVQQRAFFFCYLYTPMFFI